MAVDTNDYVYVVWYGCDATYTTFYQIWYTKYTGSWSTPLRISTYNGMNSYSQGDASIAVDTNNNPHVLWEGKATGYTNYLKIWYASYNGSWSTPECRQPTGQWMSVGTRWSRYPSSNIPTTVDYVATEGTSPYTVYYDTTFQANPEITNTPSSWAVGVIPVNTTSNTGISYFTLNNTGNCAVDVTIQGTDLSDGNTTLQFDGDDVGYVDVGTLGDYGSQINKGTVECWFRIDSIAGSFSTVMILGTFSEGSISLDYRKQGTPGAEYDRSFVFQLSPDNLWNTYFDYEFGVSNLTVEDWEWHHLAVVFDVEEWEVFCYLDAVQLPIEFDYSLENGGWESPDNWYSLLLGAQYTDEEISYGDGSFVLSDVRIWNITKTAQQIQDNMYSRLSGSESGLFAYWKLNEGTGVEAADATGNGNDGDIYGATWGSYTWALSDTATPGENIYGLYAGLDDADDLFDVIVRETATYNTLVSDLAEDATQDWGLKLYMPTSLSGYDAQQMSGTVTLVASAA
jgi:hypothetical protein